MDVKPTVSKQINATGNETIGRAAGVSSRQSVFLETLKETDRERRRRACDELLRQIDAASEELRKAPTPGYIKKYRRLVAAFLREALGQTYELNHETHWDKGGYRKNYIIVRKINQALEELTDAVMNHEKKQIDLIAKMDEIRGLLLDLYF